MIWGQYILNQYIWALCNQTISLFVLNFIKTCLAAHFWARAIWFAHWVLNIPTGTTIRFWQIICFQCDKVLQQTTYLWGAINKYVKDHLDAALNGKWRFHIRTCAKSLMLSWRTAQSSYWRPREWKKSSDFSSENWVRIYSSVPEVSNVKTLTLRENLPASKPWTSFSNSRLTRTESICLNHLQASAKASLGHPLPLWQEESGSGLGLSAQNVKNTSSF